MAIIDFHTHAFPDTLAGRAIQSLAASADNWPVYHDGTVRGLLSSMDRAGIEKAVIASIATKPSQFMPILTWSQQIASERIIPFPSVHPDDPDSAAHVHEIARRGFKGLKLHPYYQCCSLDDRRMQPIYEAAMASGLIILCHTGFDIAYPRERICDPVKVRAVVEQFPRLCFIATHLGAWEDWDEVEQHLLGRPIYLEISFALDWLGAKRTKQFLEDHPSEYLLFGTDSPWADQASAIKALQNLQLKQARERALFYENAVRLLAASRPS